MSDEHEELIHRYFNGETSPEETEALFAWVKEKDEHADRFMEHAALQADLRQQLSGVPVSEPAPSSTPMDAPPANVVTVRWQTVGLALAACLVLLLALNSEQTPPVPISPKIAAKPRPALPERTPDVRPVATLIQAEGVVWNAAENTVGDSIKPGHLDIQEGTLALEFSHGVVLALRGPARVELASLEHIRLEVGKLTARVPSGAEGFRVTTPHLDVVDLGTFFGMELDRSGQLNVAVFEGKVELDARDGSEAPRLAAGAAVRVLADGARERIDPDASPFAATWRGASGVQAHSDSVELLPSNNYGGVPRLNDHKIFLLCEDGATELRGELEVDAVRPGVFRREEDLAEGLLLKGTRIRPYLLQFRPSIRKAEAGSRREFVQIRGEVTFKNPVAGLILSDARHAGSERKLSHGVSRKLYGRQLGLELRSRQYGDEIELSEDRRTLRFNLRATAGYSDYVRVLVREEPESDPDHLAGVR